MKVVGYGKMLGHHVISSTPIVILDSSLRSDKYVCRLLKAHQRRCICIALQFELDFVKMYNVVKVQIQDTDTEVTTLKRWRQHNTFRKGMKYECKSHAQTQPK